MEKVNKNEQWLLDGNCDICRRNNYCKKDCTKRTRAKKAWIKGTVINALDESSGGAFSAILNRCDY